MKLTDLARIAIAHQQDPVLNIAAYPDSDEFVDADNVAQIEVTTSWLNPGTLCYGISAGAVCTKADLIASLRKAVEILELLPDVHTLEDLASAMGANLKNLLV